MAWEIEVCDMSVIEEYEDIPISWTVKSILKPYPRKCGSIGIELREEKLDHPYEQNLDDIPGNKPTDWQYVYDLTKWKFIVARDEGRMVGGLALTDMAGGRVLGHDFRVHPKYRSCGEGIKILDRALKCIRDDGGTQFVTQTQSDNVNTSMMLHSRGHDLVGVSLIAHPPTAQLIWLKDLSGNGRPAGN